MGNIKTKDLDKIGLTNNQLKSLVLGIISKHYKHHTNQDILSLLTKIYLNPENFQNVEVTGRIAEKIIDKPSRKIIDKPSSPDFKCFTLLPEPLPYKIYGAKHIDDAAKKQMRIAMSLPFL